MKILVVDREDITAQLMNTRLSPLGHVITHEPVKNNAIERMAKEQYDLIFIDPAPLTSAQPIILNMRQRAGKYVYVIQMGQDIKQIEAIQSGANDSISKPINPEALDKAITNAKHMIKQIERISDISTDFPSAGGVIAKSAFNQLFLSAIDRADRYGEQTFVVFIGVKNHNVIAEAEGQYASDCVSARLSQYLVRLRRQSDIIAQTESHEYALLLQRPVYETEPREAANRFAETLSGFDELFDKDGTPPEFYVRLVDLPVGSQIIEHVLTKNSDQL